MKLKQSTDCDKSRIEYEFTIHKIGSRESRIEQARKKRSTEIDWLKLERNT